MQKKIRIFIVFILTAKYAKFKIVMFAKSLRALLLLSDLSGFK